MARKTGSHAEITGPLIRQAALRLFARSGFAAVSMRQIAAEVGVQAGALYLYTPDKQTLLFELLRDHMVSLLDAWADIPKGDDPQKQLENFTRFHIRFNLERPEAVFISYMELRNLNAANFASIARLRNQYEAELEQILCDGHANGRFKVPDTRLSTKAIIAMLTGVTNWYREDGRLSQERVERLYWNMVRRAVGG